MGSMTMAKKAMSDEDHDRNMGAQYCGKALAALTRNKMCKDKIAQEIVGLKQKQAELSAEAKEASAGRTESVGALPEKFLKLYEKVRGRRRGVAVVKIDNAGTCDGCQMQIRPQLMLEVRQLETIVQCPQCQRILVLEALVTTDDEE